MPDPNMTDANMTGLTATQIGFVVLVGLAFWLVVAVVSVAPAAWRLVQARRAREAADDAGVFDPDADLIFQQLCFERWSAQMEAKS